MKMSLTEIESVKAFARALDDVSDAVSNLDQDSAALVFALALGSIRGTLPKVSNDPSPIRASVLPKTLPTEALKARRSGGSYGERLEYVVSKDSVDVFELAEKFGLSKSGARQFLEKACTNSDLKKVGKALYRAASVRVSVPKGRKSSTPSGVSKFVAKQGARFEEKLDWMTKQAKVVSPTDLAVRFGVSTPSACVFLKRACELGRVRKLERGEYVVSNGAAGEDHGA